MGSSSRTSIFILVALILVVPSTHGFWDNLRNAASEFSDFIKNNFDNASEFIKSKSSSFWEKITEKDYFALGKDKINEFLNQGRNMIPQRAQDIMRAALYRNMTESESLSELRNPSRLSESQIQIAFDNLKAPEKWTRRDINDINEALFRLPNNKLLNVEDKEALTELKRKVDSKVSGSRDLKERKRLVSLQKALFMKINGDINSMSQEEFKKVDLRQLPPYTVMQLDDGKVEERMSDFLSAGTSKSDTNERLMYLEKILDVKKLSSETDVNKARDIMNSLGSLREQLMEEDFSEQVLNNQNDRTISDLLKQNKKLAIKKMYLSPKTAMKESYRFAKMKNITEEDLENEDMENLGLALYSDLKLAAQNGAIQQDDINAIVDGMKNFDGPGTLAKNKILASVLADDIEDQQDPVVSVYDPNVVVELKLTVFEKMDRDAKKILETFSNLDRTRTGILKEKVESRDYSSFNKIARELVTTKELETLSDNQVLEIGVGLPPGSVATIETVDRFLGKLKNINPDDIRSTSQAILQNIGAKEASKFNSTRIFELLRILSEKKVEPGLMPSKILNEKLRNFTRTVGQSTSIRFLSESDIDYIPLSVIAAYGTNQIALLTDKSKITLLKKMAEIDDPELKIYKAVRESILREGMKALRQGKSGAGLRPGDLDVIWSAIADVPVEELNNAAEEVMYDIVMQLNKMTEYRGARLCIDMERRYAFARMIKQAKGNDPSEWKDIEDIKCIAYLLTFGDISKIKPEVITSRSCYLNESTPSIERKEALCNASLGASQSERMKNLEKDFFKAQVDASMKIIEEVQKQIEEEEDKRQGRPVRTKRATSSTESDEAICNRAAYGGVDMFSIEELKNMKPKLVWECKENFGSKDMPKQKAEILAPKVSEYKNVTMLTATEIEELGYLLKGFSSSKLNTFPTFRYTAFDDVVASLGAQRDFSENQEKILARKVTIEWRAPGDMSATELQMVKNLICGFESADINEITPESFRGAISVLSTLKKCPKQQSDALANLIEKSYGKPETWDSTTLVELGSVVAFLLPEQLSKIDPKAFEGLLPSASQKFTDEDIKVLKLEQIEYLDPAAAGTFDEVQRSSFSDMQLKKLDDVKDTGGESSGTTIYLHRLSWLLVLSCIVW